MEYNTIGIGGLYRFSEEIYLGIMIKNAFGFALEDEYSSFALPRYFTIGLSKRKRNYTLSFDSEYICGEFGGLEEKTMEIWMLRAGFEKKINSWMKGRLGLMYPVIAYTSSLGDFKEDIPWPQIGGAVGLGMEFQRWIVDLSIYGDLAKSYVEQTPTVTAVASLTYKF